MSLFALSLLVACSDGLPTVNDVSKDDGLVEDLDEEPCVIVHTAVAGTQTFGADVPIEATVTDQGSGVQHVSLFYKNEVDGSADWEDIILIESSPDVYTGRIPGDEHRGGGVDYYLECTDRQSNSAASPEDGASDPYHFRISE